MSKHSPQLLDPGDEMQPENNWILLVVVSLLVTVIAFIIFLLHKNG